MRGGEGILLASQSPRRRELIGLLGLPVQAVSAEVDETPRPGEAPADYVRRLAAAKARAVDPTPPPVLLPSLTKGGEGEVAAGDGGGERFVPRWVVAADTAVVDGDDILGKPADEAEAEAMLRRLRGRAHAVLTGVAVLDAHTKRLESAVVRTMVHMRAFSNAEIAAYIASGDPMDKAGAYAIQNRAFAPVERIVGCYANVMGLPLCALGCLLRRLGASPAPDLARRCTAALGYNCEGNDPACRLISL